jgi:hypothetical protein
MNSKEIVNKLKSHMSFEQDLAHRVFLDGFKKLSEAEAEDILSVVYASYLIRGKLLENIIKYCVVNDVYLPSFGDLVEL